MKFYYKRSYSLKYLEYATIKKKINISLIRIKVIKWL